MRLALNESLTINNCEWSSRPLLRTLTTLGVGVTQFTQVF